ncbi:hypothetical protein K458DRAFT_393005 [Lentithecium fluviatile CBS 122367]|uniref:Rhodopsin domain-containing protein n=1 Tax=Lentithecium fluviatile CBS 122367 TaxID=1168545 RepID=A0A6G1IQI2_9PLEO|nr:hypothetical protein K458DRAFT_393005 [Lentithecium fluviatile CBS 122367]
MWSTTPPSPEYLAENNSAHLLQSCIVFLILETFFMTLLYLSRLVPDSSQKANWTMILLMTGAYTVCLSKITVAILMVQIGGAGRHRIALPPHTLRTGLKLNLTLQIVCPLATSLSKLSVLSLFYTIFGRTSPRYRLAIHLTALLVLAILLMQFVIPFANCRPLAYNWDMAVAGGKCAIAPLALWRYLSIPNMLTTLIIVGIPVPALWRLKVSAATKAGLGVVFTVCVAGLVAAVMRFHAFVQVESFNDITYEEIKPLCWTVAESGIYLVAGVMPTLRPLARKVCGEGVFDRILSGALRSGRSGRSGRSEESWENKRWSRIVLRGENSEKVVEKKGGCEMVEEGSEGSEGSSIGGVEDEEKGKMEGVGMAV